MTNVGKIPVGPQLDALVAERVMAGLRAPYSTDIAAAWQVWNQLKSMSNGQYGDLWVKFLKALAEICHREFEQLALTTCCDITWILSPETICRAALKAVGYEGEAKQ